MIALLLGLALADSPLTTPEYHLVYAEHPMVATAAEGGVIDDELCEFLVRGKRGMDLKAAVVNALSWNIDGQDNATAFLHALAKRKDRPAAELLAFPTLIEPHEAFVYGYLLAMDDYFEPSAALPWLAQAREQLPKSKTVALIESLVVAQIALEGDWCAVYTGVDAVFEAPKLRPDMKFAAETVIRDYINLYEDSCPTEEELALEQERLEQEEAALQAQQEQPKRKRRGKR